MSGDVVNENGNGFSLHILESTESNGHWPNRPEETTDIFLIDSLPELTSRLCDDPLKFFTFLLNSVGQLENGNVDDNGVERVDTVDEGERRIRVSQLDGRVAAENAQKE